MIYRSTVTLADGMLKFVEKNLPEGVEDRLLTIYGIIYNYFTKEIIETTMCMKCQTNDSVDMLMITLVEEN